MRYLLLPTLLFTPIIAIAAVENEITLSAKIEDDPSEKEEEFYLKLISQDKEKKFENNLTIRIENNYQISDGTETQTEESMDIEDQLKIYRENKKNFYSLYFRRKDDEITTSTTNNYKLYSAGYGIEQKKEKQIISFLLSIGRKESSEGDATTITPEGSYQNEYKNLQYKLYAKLTKANKFRSRKSGLELSYPMSKHISLKYLLEYEKSKEKDGNKDYERLNQLALSIKF